MKKYIKFILKTTKEFWYYLWFQPQRLTLTNIKAYLQGNWRLLHLDDLDECIRDQFYYRIVYMDPTCRLNGECPCKCPYPNKQLSDESCQNSCYPPFLEKKDWELFVKIKPIDITFVRAEAKQILGL